MAAGKRLGDLEELDLSGFVFKKDSAELRGGAGSYLQRAWHARQKGCGVVCTRLSRSVSAHSGGGGGRFRDPLLRENFIERVFCYCRWQDLIQRGVTRQALVRFHTIQKYLLLAHSVPHYRQLGRLVAQVNEYRPKDLAIRYGELFMQALAAKATVRKHVNVPAHPWAISKNDRSRKGRAVGCDRGLPPWTHAADCSADIDQTLRPVLRCRIHSRPCVSESASGRS